MNRVLEQQAISQVPEMLAHGLDLEPARVHTAHNGKELDLIVRAGSHKFAIEWKGAGTVALISAAIRQLRAYIEASRSKLVPVVAVPFMGEAGHELCRKEGISRVALSGNAHIVAPGLRIHVVGKPNKFKQPGRPKNVFAQSSRRQRSAARTASILIFFASSSSKDLRRRTGLPKRSDCSERYHI